MIQTVLITGTSSGIGEAAAKLFLSEGWNVVATARRPEALGEWSRSDRAAAVRMDVTDDTSILAAVADAIVRFGRIDVLVNNAGIGLAGPVEGIAREQLQQQFDTNFFGLVATACAVLPRMRENKRGLIINVTSITGRVGLPFLSPYNACKFAAEGLTESLHFELRPFGIRVKLVEPGGVKTKFSHAWATHPAYEPSLSAVQAKMTAGAAKAAEPEAVAKVILKAAQDGSDRLRYTATDGGALLAFRKLMPEGLWRSFIAKTFKTSPPRRSQGWIRPPGETDKGNRMTTRQHPVGSGLGARTTAGEALGGGDLSGKVAMVTGGYSGLGLETTRVLAGGGATVIVPARSHEKAHRNLEGIPRVEGSVTKTRGAPRFGMDEG